MVAGSTHHFMQTCYAKRGLVELREDGNYWLTPAGIEWRNAVIKRRGLIERVGTDGPYRAELHLNDSDKLV